MLLTDCFIDKHKIRVLSLRSGITSSRWSLRLVRVAGLRVRLELLVIT